MKVIMTVKLPLEPFNTLVRKGTAGKALQSVLDAVKPEAAYFYDVDGCRGGTLVVDLKEVASIPAIVEPFFLTFNAECRIHPAMTAQDLAAAGLEKIGKKWG